jgi:hypothetical protein
MMLGTTIILGVFLAWRYTHYEEIKQAFLLALLFAALRFAIKFTRHRHKWAKFVPPLVKLIQPGPPHSFVWGHLRFLGEASKKLGLERPSFELVLEGLRKYGPDGVL